MNLSRLKHVALAAGILATAAGASHAQGLELALLVDTSDSVNSIEYTLQMAGYVQAFQSAGVKQAVIDTPGGVAASLLVFSGNGQQAVEVDWKLLLTAADCDVFANDIFLASQTREFAGFTGIAQGLAFAQNQLETNLFNGARRVIDISGDGEENVDANPASVIAARNNAFSSGITINGLPIVTAEFPNLATYYDTNVVTPNGNTFPANDFNDFSAAVIRKLQVEIGGAPEPGTFALLGVGALAFGGLVTRRKKA